MAALSIAIVLNVFSELSAQELLLYVAPAHTPDKCGIGLAVSHGMMPAASYTAPS
jgi:hypothetical protein